MFALGLVALASAQSNSSAAVQPSNSTTVADRKWRIHQQWMRQVAKMGTHACSHDTEQSYLMKRMIDAVHEAAQNRCGGTCANKPQPRKRKQKKACKKVHDHPEEEEESESVATVVVTEPETPVVVVPEPETPVVVVDPESETTVVVPEPESEATVVVTEPETPTVLPPVVIVDPCASTGNGLGFEKFEQAHGVRVFNGTCAPGLEWARNTAGVNASLYKCERKDLTAINQATKEETLLERNFRVTVGTSDCEVKKEWKHKNGKVLESTTKGGETVADSCTNTGHNWNAWRSDVNGARAQSGKGSCEAGDAWAVAAKVDGEYKCLRTESTMVNTDGLTVPVVTFQIAHTKAEGCTWVKQYKHINSIMTETNARNGVQIGVPYKDYWLNRFNFNMLGDKCATKLEDAVKNYDWSHWNGSGLSGEGIQKLHGKGSCAVGDAWKALDANKDSKIVCQKKDPEQWIEREPCRKSPRNYFNIFIGTPDDPCYTRIQFRHQDCWVQKEIFRWNEVASTGRSRGWKYRARSYSYPRPCTRIYVPSTLPACVNQGPCEDKDLGWEHFEKVGGVKDYDGKGNCKIGTDWAKANQKVGYSCSKYAWTGTNKVRFIVKYGTGSCIFRKTYFHTGSSLTESIQKNQDKVSTPVTVTPVGVQIVYDLVETNCVNGVCDKTDKGTHTPAVSGAGRRRLCAKKAHRHHRAARDNLCAIYMRHIFNMAKKSNVKPAAVN